MEAAFRVAQPSDIEILLPLLRDFYEYDHHHFDEGVVRTALAEFLNDDSLGQAWLILTGDIIVGYTVLTFGYSLDYGGRDAFVDEIFIRENQRGRGIGRQTFAFMETWGRNHGLKAIHLEVERANHQARAIYQALGFEEQDQYLMTCWLGKKWEPDNIKVAELLDVDLLTSLVRERDLFHNAAPMSRTSVTELLNHNPLGRVWLIQDETEVCGYVILTYSYSLEFHGRDALLDQLHLRQNCQQADFTSRSILFAAKMAHSMGAHALHVRVKRNDTQTQEAYRQAGFEDDDSYLMTKRIDL